MPSGAGDTSRPLPSASIVIPTCNRRPDLERVLRAIAPQRASNGIHCQVVVVDDGSSDGTGEWLQSRADRDRLTVIRQRNAGPAGARNRGVEVAEGDVILFLGDDTVPQERWLLEHLESHRIGGVSEATAVLGYTSFPASESGPFLRWINEFGAQFGYALIDDPTHVPFNFFYTSNISIPRRILTDLGGFREDFPAAAWEDIEFAYRATRSGLRIRYLPRARTIHHHRVEVGSFCRRQRTSGLSGAIFAEIHPELAGFLGVPCIGRVTGSVGLERLLLRCGIAAGEIFHGTVPDRVYRRYFDLCYLEGLVRGLKNHARSTDAVTMM
jgi:GT2 family glycosyltransferase